MMMFWFNLISKQVGNLKALIFILALYAGGIEDWIDGHLGIDNTYTIMMFRPSDSYSTKLITEVC